MMSLVTPIPIPNATPDTVIEERRLWIGNLDIRITDGPFAGQPRGYGFVTYKLKDNAELMKKELDGMKIGSKYISVKWAHSLEKGDNAKKKTDAITISALSVKKEKKISPQMQIKAIEMKLKMMEHSGIEDFNINIPATGSTSLNQLSCKRIQSNELKQKKIRHRPYR